MNKKLKFCLAFSFILSLSPLIANAFNLQIPLFSWFALSLPGLLSGKVFQLFTYPFLFSVTTVNNPFYFLTPIFMIFLARFAQAFIDLKGERHLIIFSLGSILATAMTVLAINYFSQLNYLFFGPDPLFFALLTVLCCIIHDLEILLLFIPIKARYFILFGLAINLLHGLDTHNHLSFFAILTGVLFGYVYAVVVLKIHSPFQNLYRFEVVLRQWLTFRGRKQKCVIVDFRTGRQISK